MFAEECHKAFIRGQQALDRLLWNETARYYNAYTQYNPNDSRHLHKSPTWYTDVHDGEAVTDERYEANVTYEADPDPLGAIMTDTFYSQVCSSEMNVRCTCAKIGSVCIHACDMFLLLYHGCHSLTNQISQLEVGISHNHLRVTTFACGSRVCKLQG